MRLGGAGDEEKGRSRTDFSVQQLCLAEDEGNDFWKDFLKPISL